MHRSAKETKVLHPVSRALHMEYRAALECSELLDGQMPEGALDRRLEPGIKPMRIPRL